LEADACAAVGAAEPASTVAATGESAIILNASRRDSPLFSSIFFTISSGLIVSPFLVFSLDVVTLIIPVYRLKLLKSE
jgi:hypothetical protein